MAILSVNYTNLDYEKMAKAIGLKSKHMPMLLESFLEEASISVIKLDTAITANDLVNIAADAHAIKGSAGNLRLNELYEMSKDMELAAKANDADFDYNGHLSAVKSAMDTITL